MVCTKCQAHRDRIKAAAKSGSIIKTAMTTAQAVRALGENAGRKLIRPRKESRK